MLCVNEAFMEGFLQGNTEGAQDNLGYDAGLVFL
jgi:hypothetical protein